MSKCYICDSEITEANFSDEHVLLNSIGGRLKSKELLCRACNSRIGYDPDTELSKQLNPLSNILGIERERGEPQPFRGVGEESGEHFDIGVGGKPRPIKPKISQTPMDDKSVRITIEARDKKEARQILTGLKRKYPKINTDEFLASAIEKEYILEERLQSTTSIGGPVALRSICKSAVDYFILRNGDRKFIHHLIPFLEGNQPSDSVNHYLNNVCEIADNEVSHIIYLRGDPNGKILYSYVELFNIYGFLVLLNSDYEGEEIRSVYAYDVLTSIELSKSINLDLTRDFVLSYDSRKEIPNYDFLQKRFSRVLGIGLARQEKSNNDRILEETIANSLGKYPKGCIITPEMVNEIVQEFMKRIEPYIVQFANLRHKRAMRDSFPGSGLNQENAKT